MLDRTREILRDGDRLCGRRRDRLWRAYDNILFRLGPGVAMPLRRRSTILKLRQLSHPIAARLGTSDLMVIHQIFLQGEYAPLLELAPSDLQYVLDLGSNAGYTIRYWAENFPSCKVIGAEPEPGNLAMCQRNIALGGIGDRAVVSGSCVLGTNQKARLSVSGLEWSFRVTSGENAGAEAIETPSITVPELLADIPAGAPIGILKCDIEGSESDLFKNCAAWVNRVQLAAVEVHDPYTVDELLADITAAGGRMELTHCSKDQAGKPFLAFLKQPATAQCT